jgi:hypothetical protein
VFASGVDGLPGARCKRRIARRSIVRDKVGNFPDRRLSEVVRAQRDRHTPCKRRGKTMTATSTPVRERPASRKRSIQAIHARIERGPFLLDDVNVRPGDSYRPTTPGSEELLPEGMDLIVRQAGMTMLTLTPGMTGTARRGGASYTLAELLAAGHAIPAGPSASRLAMAPGDLIEFDSGEFHVRLDYTEVGAIDHRPLGGDIFRGNLGLLVLGSVAAHCLVLLTAFMSPVTGHTLELDDLSMRSRFVPAQSTPDIVTTELEAKETEDPETDSGAEGEVADASRATPRPRAVPTRRQPREKLQAKDAGVLGAIAAQRGTLFFGAGAADADRLTAGVLYGKAAPEGEAGHALLDGSLDALLKSGPSKRVRIRDHGIGNEIASTGVRTRPQVVLKERKTKVPARVHAGDPRVDGGPGKAAIRRAISNNRARFRYCYEQGLKRNPALAGRMVVSFTIASDGRVLSSRKVGSTLGDAKVEQCVVRKMGGVRFPKFPSGTARVTYPFQFVGR